MTDGQIREIVKMTLDELAARDMLKDSYTETLKIVERRLKQFFNSSGSGNGVSHALRELSDDPYIDVIYLQYRDGKTLEWIAEYYNKDSSTIKRNKKRIVKALYEMIREC